MGHVTVQGFEMLLIVGINMPIPIFIYEILAPASVTPIATPYWHKLPPDGL